MSDQGRQSDSLLERFATFRQRVGNGPEIVRVRDHIEQIWKHARVAANGFQYHIDTLLPGHYWVAGAGLQGMELVQALARRDDVQIMGFIDRKAHLYNGYGGLPVVPAGETHGLSIIVANRVWEQDILDDLIVLGIPPDQLIPTYTAERFVNWASQTLAGLPVAKSLDTLIIRDTSRIGLIPEKILQDVFPAKGSFVIYTSSHPYDSSSNIYQSSSSQLGLSHIMHVIERYQPKTVLLATMPHFNDWALALCRPDRNWRFIFEPNDLTLVYGDALRELVPMSQEHLDRCRLAEAWALRYADATVTNCQGPQWERLLDKIGGRALSYFSGPRGKPAAASSQAEIPTFDANVKLRILYAGGIPQNHLRFSWTTDYRFLPALTALARQDNITVDIFNAYHSQPEHDHYYRDIMELADMGLQYFRARPFDEILSQASYDFGWLHRGDIPRRQTGETGAGNDILVLNKRFTSYLAAGLPLIIDDQLDSMAELVEQFRAGIVLPTGKLNTEELAEQLRQADRVALRAGVQRLYAHIAATNTKTLAEMAWFGRTTTKPSEE